MPSRPSKTSSTTGDSPGATRGAAQSLEQFVRDRRQREARAHCKVCHLPASFREQLGRAAGAKGFSRAEQLAWLHAVGPDQSITVQDLQAHTSGRHEDDLLTEGGNGQATEA